MGLHDDNSARLAATKDIPIDRLLEIAMAERDGRLVVLPCKVGDTVYSVVHPEKCEPVISTHIIKSLGEAANLVGRMGKGFLIDRYLTRQEAEEDLERLKGKGGRKHGR